MSFSPSLSLCYIHFLYTSPQSLQFFLLSWALKDRVPEPYITVHIINLMQHLSSLDIMSSFHNFPTVSFSFPPSRILWSTSILIIYHPSKIWISPYLHFLPHSPPPFLSLPIRCLIFLDHQHFTLPNINFQSHSITRYQSNLLCVGDPLLIQFITLSPAYSFYLFPILFHSHPSISLPPYCLPIPLPKHSIEEGTKNHWDITHACFNPFFIFHCSDSVFLYTDWSNPVNGVMSNSLF